MLAEFGFSRWGADVVRLAEPLSARGPNPLAPRARSLARNDGVTLTVTSNIVEGLVSRGGQASVARVEFVAPSPEFVGVVRELSGAATEPDDDLHRRVTAAAGSPGPKILAADCSCTARNDRCLHVLATLYALAAAVDHRPLLALELQGFLRLPECGGAARSVTPPQPVRWIPLAGLGIRDYWTVSDEPTASTDPVDS